MENVLLVTHLIITLFLIIVVLMQRSEGGGIGLGTASSSGLVSVRGTANFMTKLTALLAALFIIMSMVLAVMAAQDMSEKSLIDKLADEPAMNLEQFDQIDPAPPVSE